MWLGCDPEIFASKDGELVPAFRFLRSKQRINMLKAKIYRSQMYWDGYQAEMRWPNGHSCVTELVNAIQVGLWRMNRQLKRIVPGASLIIQNTVRLPETELCNAPDQFIQFGCDPSHNVYGLKPMLIDNPRKMPWRWAGGHIHFSYIFEAPLAEYPIMEQAHKHIENLDKVLGVWAVGAARNIDVPMRRQFYGLPGEFRLPKHAAYEWVADILDGIVSGWHYEKVNTIPGLEYRTLSNFWLCHPRITQITLEIARMAILRGDYWKADKSEVIETISKMDHEKASEIIKRNGQWFMDSFRTKFDEAKIVEAIDVALKGVEQSVPSLDIAQNWQLNERNYWGYYDVPTWNRHS